MIVLCLMTGGYVSSQSTSREIETYERWENGELVEERSNAKENGKPIENFDFEAWKQERQLPPDSSKVSFDFESKKHEMAQRMKEMQVKSNAFFEKKKAEMEIKMNEFHKRVDKMECDIEKRIKERSEKSDIETKETKLKTVQT